MTELKIACIFMEANLRLPDTYETKKCYRNIMKLDTNSHSNIVFLKLKRLNTKRKEIFLKIPKLAIKTPITLKEKKLKNTETQTTLAIKSKKYIYTDKHTHCPSKCSSKRVTARTHTRIQTSHFSTSLLVAAEGDARFGRRGGVLSSTRRPAVVRSVSSTDIDFGG